MRPSFPLLGLLACSPADPVLTSDAATDGATTTTGGPPVGGTGTTTSSGMEASTTGTSEADAESTAAYTSTGADPVCGNGVVEDGESCDDVGESAACDVDCTLAECGDGVTNAAAREQCDDAGESAACNASCSVSDCGDGIVNAAAQEQCDEGGQSRSCDLDCTFSECGDGVLNAVAGEQCDEGGATPLCDADCTLLECGDGIIDVLAGEGCDDAGESATCNSNCTPASCGDGIVNATAGEGCDDVGESLACDADCSPSACGDGVANATAGEACDGAGDTAACDADCTSSECGDGYVNAAAGEGCDGAVPAGTTCQSLVALGGTLGCGPACAYDTSDCTELVLALEPSPIKRFDFSWGALPGTDYFQLEEQAAPGEPFVQLGGDLVGTSSSLTIPLHFRRQASYRLGACNMAGCTLAPTVSVTSSLAEAVGYFKASTTDIGDGFGGNLALSSSGDTLVVSSSGDDSSATGIGGNQLDAGAANSGAVFVFVRDDMGAWAQQAYIKASNTDAVDSFGTSVALAGDGNTLVVGASNEDSSATGIDGNQADDSAVDAGAVYVFVRDGMGAWTQQAYIKASNTDAGDSFGQELALSVDGNTLAVAAVDEDSSATGIGGDQTDDSAIDAGAAYVFVRDGMGGWSQQAYIKASNTDAQDTLGGAIQLSGDGHTLVVGAHGEDSSATGIDGDQGSDAAIDAGAAYVFVRDGMGAWSQQAYIKASNTDPADRFGGHLALDLAGDTLAVGAWFESSSATGIDGNQADDSAADAGAVYVFVRDPVGEWSQQAYVKPTNTDADDFFSRVALSADGQVLAVGARGEDSSSAGIGGNQGDDSLSYAGAVYVLVRDVAGAWSHTSYVKASNPGTTDQFGSALVLSASGDTLVVGALQEDSSATGIGGNQNDNATTNSGAVYFY